MPSPPVELHRQAPPPPWVRIVACLPAAFGLCLGCVAGNSGPALNVLTVLVIAVFWALAGWMLGVGPTTITWLPDEDVLVTEWTWLRWRGARRAPGGFEAVTTERHRLRASTWWEVVLVRRDGSRLGLHPFRGAEEEASALADSASKQLGLRRT